MTAKGKINASTVTAGDRIMVKVYYDAEGHVRGILQSATKTGENVFTARVIGKSFRATRGLYESRGRYVIETTAGEFEAVPVQTMWLASEDAAGIKRAHVEALAEDEARAYAAMLVDLHQMALDEDEVRTAGDSMHMVVTPSGVAKFRALASSNLRQRNPVSPSGRRIPLL